MECARRIVAAAGLAGAVLLMTGDSGFAADRQKGPELPEGVEATKDIVYAKTGAHELHLDFYRPGGPEEPLPLVVWVHGGAWSGGSKRLPEHAAMLLGYGYAVASIEYRLSRQAIFPAAIEDCKAAVSYLRLHAEELGVDPAHFGAWGGSAGGHLVALLGTSRGTDVFDTHPVTKEASSEVQAVCDWYGPTDFLRMNDFPGSIDHDAARSPESRFIGGPIQENRDKAARANPITYIDKGDPPFLIMHGDKDQSVPYNQSELLHEALTKAGVESTLHKVERAGHGLRKGRHLPPLVERVAAFFDAHLKPQPGGTPASDSGGKSNEAGEGGGKAEDRPRADEDAGE